MSSIANWEIFKERYGTGVVYILPEQTDICNKLFPYVSEEGRPGAAFNVPVETSLELGYTFNMDGTGFTLNDAVDSVYQNARLAGGEIAFTGRIPYATAAQSQNPGGGNAGRAFFGAVEGKMASMGKGGNFIREVWTMYGAGTGSAASANIGVVNASVSGANLAAPQIVNITRATWSHSLWMNLRGGKVDIYQSDATTVRDTGVTVQGMVGATNRVQLFKTASSATVAAGDIIVLNGARTKNPYGIQPIMENSTTMFGIDAAVEPTWQAVSYAVGGAMTCAKIHDMGVRLSNNGLNDGFDVVLSNAAFSDLCKELEDDQRTNDDRPNRIMGPSEIRVRTPAGDAIVTKHQYMKQSIGWAIGKGAGTKRIGAQELGFNVANMKKFLETPVSGAAAYELRMYGQSAPFAEKPAWCGQFTGITSSADTSPA